MHQQKLDQIGHIQAIYAHIQDIHHLQHEMFEHLRFTQATEAHNNTQMENLSQKLNSLQMDIFDSCHTSNLSRHFKKNYASDFTLPCII